MLGWPFLRTRQESNFVGLSDQENGIYFLAGIFFSHNFSFEFQHMQWGNCLKDTEAPSKQMAKEKLSPGPWKGSVTECPLGSLHEFSVTVPSNLIRNNDYRPVTLSCTFDILSTFYLLVFNYFFSFYIPTSVPPPSPSPALPTFDVPSPHPPSTPLGSEQSLVYQVEAGSSPSPLSPL